MNKSKKVSIILCENKTTTLSFYVTEVVTNDTNLSIQKLMPILASALVEHMKPTKIQWSIIDMDMQKLESDTTIDFENETVESSAPFVDADLIKKAWRIVNDSKK